VANAPPLAEALGRWHEFYALLGTASGTLVGLLFVAATVGSGVFSTARSAPIRVFLSSSVIHFSTILVACLVVLVPVLDWEWLGVTIAVCGLFGIGYYVMTWRDMVRDGLSKAIDLEDRIWYTMLPLVGYAFESASGVTLALRITLGCEALALSMGMLLIVGIHNAWDITVWSMMRRGNTPPPPE
jgi:hypothetical protein